MEAARVFDALGDGTRRAIIERLRSGPLPVSELAAALPVKRPAVSKHLGILSEAGLVEHRRAGTRHLYALAQPGFGAAQVWLVDMWDGALNRFAERVAGRAEQQDKGRAENEESL